MTELQEHQLNHFDKTTEWVHNIDNVTEMEPDLPRSSNATELLSDEELLDNVRSKVVSSTSSESDIRFTLSFLKDERPDLLNDARFILKTANKNIYNSIASEFGWKQAMQYSHFDGEDGRYHTVTCELCKKSGKFEGYEETHELPSLHGTAYRFNCSCGGRTLVINDEGEDIKEGTSEDNNPQKQVETQLEEVSTFDIPEVIENFPVEVEMIYEPESEHVSSASEPEALNGYNGERWGPPQAWPMQVTASISTESKDKQMEWATAYMGDEYKHNGDLYQVVAGPEPITLRRMSDGQELNI